MLYFLESPRKVKNSRFGNVVLITDNTLMTYDSSVPGQNLEN